MRKITPTKSAETHPWIVQKPYSDPRFFRGWKDAQAAVRKDLESLRDDFRRLQAEDAMKAIGGLLSYVSMLPVEQGSTVAGVVDPVTGVKYRAELIKRATL